MKNEPMAFEADGGGPRRQESRRLHPLDGIAWSCAAASGLAAAILGAFLTTSDAWVGLIIQFVGLGLLGLSFLALRILVAIGDLSHRLPRASNDSRSVEPTPKPIDCLSCGGVIPGGSSSCPSCGWSYGDLPSGP